MTLQHNSFDNRSLPKVSVGIISFNRMHYLKAVIESARRCVCYPNLEWIVVDGNSVEAGLKQYLQSLTWIDRCIFTDLDFIGSINLIISEAKGEYVILWPDDVQFIVEGGWLTHFIRELEANRWIGSVGLNCLRRKTIDEIWGGRRFLRYKEILSELKRYGINFRRQRVIPDDFGYGLRTYGWRSAGIIGAGILSLTRTEIWRSLGPWRRGGADSTLVDATGGSEIEMLRSFKESKLILQKATPLVPVAADIVDDEKGCKAKVRKGNRYGRYLVPQRGSLYYEIIPHAEAAAALGDDLPLSFERIVRPIDYELPLDREGNLLKCAINSEIVSPIV